MNKERRPTTVSSWPHTHTPKVNKFLGNDNFCEDTVALKCCDLLHSNQFVAAPPFHVVRGRKRKSGWRMFYPDREVFAHFLIAQAPLKCFKGLALLKAVRQTIIIKS